MTLRMVHRIARPASAALAAGRGDGVDGSDRQLRAEFGDTARPMPHPRHLVHNRLRPWQRRATDAVGALLLVTGLAWLPLHYGRGANALPLPAEAWLIRLHGLAAFGALFMLGVLAGSHVPHGWRATARGRGREQRRWGLALCVLAALLAATAYQLYYFAPDNLRPALGVAHSIAGGAMAVALVVHRRVRRRGQPR